MTTPVPSARPRPQSMLDIAAGHVGGHRRLVVGDRHPAAATVIPP